MITITFFEKDFEHITQKRGAGRIVGNVLFVRGPCRKFVLFNGTAIGAIFVAAFPRQRRFNCRRCCDTCRFTCKIHRYCYSSGRHHNDECECTITLTFRITGGSITEFLFIGNVNWFGFYANYTEKSFLLQIWQNISNDLFSYCSDKSYLHVISIIRFIKQYC